MNVWLLFVTTERGFVWTALGHGKHRITSFWIMCELARVKACRFGVVCEEVEVLEVVNCEA